MTASAAPSPFEDPSLHLAVLEAAWKKGLLPEFDKYAFYRDVLKRDWDAERDGYEVDDDVLAALLAIPLAPAVLAAIDTIEWGGGHEAQHLVVHFWDGEDETFTIGDLSGIEACANVRELHLGSASLQDLTPLLDLPALKRLDIGKNYLDDERNRGVLAKLKARGVALETPDDIAARQSAGHEASLRKRDIETGIRAFQEKRYGETVAALTPHESSLDGSEKMKLQFARKKSGDGA